MSAPSKRQSAEEARFEAQKLAFAPLIFQAARVLRDTGILEELRRGGEQPTAAIAERCELSHYACTVLLEAGLAAGAVTRDESGWKLTKVGYHLLKDPLTRANMDFAHDVCYQAMYYLEDSLREGKPVGLKVFGDWPTVYQGLMELPRKARDSWLRFDHYYSDDSFPQAVRIVLSLEPKSILDIGGNLGTFASLCAQSSPDVELAILDLPRTLDGARQRLRAADLEQRVALHAGDMLDPETAPPAGHDVIWMSQFLCCFSEEEVVSILERCRKALTPGGRVVIMDTFWDCQRFQASSYCLQATSLYFTCVANGNSRMYDLKTVKKCLEKAGLIAEVQHHNVGLTHTILECVPR
jgi:hypothetical protein